MRISDWSSDVCSSDLIGEVAAGDLLPTDDSVDEINGIVVGRKGHQYAAIEYFHAALIDEFGFEADGRAIRAALQIMIGQARKQGPAGHIINIMNLAFNVAFPPSRQSHISHSRIFHARREIQKHAMRYAVLSTRGDRKSTRLNS